MKAILKALGQSLWIIMAFVFALQTKSTFNIIVLGILGILNSFGFSLAKQMMDEVKRDDIC